MSYKSNKKNNVVSENSNITADGYSSIFLQNIGDCDVMIDDNIPLSPGDSFKYGERPDVVIDDSTSVRFTGAGLVKKVLVIKTYFKEVSVRDIYTK